jgi:sugar phosphate isomerase/epimerase
MTPLSRRSFLRSAGLGAAVAGLASADLMTLHANPLGLPIGSQTWPHRALIKDGRFAELSATLAGLGVQALEMCSPIDYEDFAPLRDGKQVKKILADHGLACVSGHFGMKELRTRQAESIAWAHDVGITQMITASLDAGDHPTLDDVKRAADEYNKMGEQSAKAGIQQGLHNEGFELSTVDGKRTYDLLLELLDPKLVKFQFQVSTISRGYDAAEYFTKYPGRFVSMHVQDWSSETKKTMAVGQGTLDWVKIFTAAKTGGIRNYFVEMNLDLMQESVPYLRKLNV